MYFCWAYIYQVKFITSLILTVTVHHFLDMHMANPWIMIHCFTYQLQKYFRILLRIQNTTIFYLLILCHFILKCPIVIRKHLYGQKDSYAMYNNKISWLQHLFYRLTHWANCANTGVVKCLYLGNTQMTLCNEECSLLKTLS